MAGFVIIEFSDMHAFEVVPVRWLRKNGCMWPPVPGKVAKKWIKKVVKPQKDWSLHRIRILKTFDSYNKAVRRLRASEEMSDFSSDDEISYGQEKRKSVPHRLNLSSEEDNCYKARKRLKASEEISDFSADDEMSYGREKSKSVPCRLGLSSNGDSRETNSLPFMETSRIIVPTVKEHSINQNPGAIPQEIFITNEIPETEPEESLETPKIEIVDIQTVSDLGTETPKNDNINIESTLRMLRKEVLLIKETQKLMLENQRIILQKLSGSNLIVNNLPFNLPARSIEELMLIEEYLNDPSIMDSLIKKMSTCGGHSVENNVKRVLMKLIDNSVAMLYSWVGAKGKYVFSTLQIAKVVFAAVRSNPSLDVNFTTDAAIESALKNWLRHAKARHTNRLKDLASNSTLMI